MGKMALVVIDAQTALVEQVYQPERLLQNIAGLLERARAAGVPVVFVQDDDVSEPGSDGWQVHPAIAPLETERRVRKKATDSFYGTDLNAFLTANGVKTLVVCGCKTDYCVDTATRRATTLGYQVIVAKDAHSTTDNGVLTAEQIIAHHNKNLHGLDNLENYSQTMPSSEIEFAAGGNAPFGAKKAGERVYIRTFEVSDAEAMTALLVKNRAFWGQFETSRSDDEYTVEYQRRNLEQMRAEWVKDRGYFFGIFLQENDRLIGDIGIHMIARGPCQSAFVGYSLDEEHNGKGYATEALRLVVDFGFHDINLHRLQADAAPENPASYRVLEKAGFQREGTERKNLLINGKWQDHLQYAIINEHWEG
ncbi:RimJ/RimL family protein N-acetyltransferase [Tumebacillus sp. BK434]|uniref:isochorismatase family protein n=1 Tax=Tumebacillus sp. BK434 TaxID=2512169 RepID=UPI0010DBA32B|nr:isochorismatase family protein [Tumebacillus sp. BK434]TCP57571.1 RimJ/RimL family protein N-acetyltransferase [Tumebacillus sp. BK434]